MVFHSFVISLDAQRTDAQIKSDIDAFIEASRVQPGTLGNLYPPRKHDN